MDVNRNEGGEKQGSPTTEGGLLSFDLCRDTDPTLASVLCSHHLEILNHFEQKHRIFIFALALPIGSLFCYNCWKRGAFGKGSGRTTSWAKVERPEAPDRAEMNQWRRGNDQYMWQGRQKWHILLVSI